MARRMRRNTTLRALGALVMPALGAAACIDRPTGPEPIPLEETTFAPSLGVDLGAMTRTEEGLYYEDLVTGGGETVVAGDVITVHYTGWLANGTEFDSSIGGDPFSLRIGVGDVIAGWDLGVPGMRVGGKRKLVIPSYLAFGGYSDSRIPAYANLVFDVEVLAIEGEPETQ